MPRNHFQERFKMIRIKYHSHIGLIMIGLFINGDKSRSQSPKFCNLSPIRETKVDYQTLVIDNLCFHCAKGNNKSIEWHTDRKNLSCKLCKKESHVSKVCINL